MNSAEKLDRDGRENCNPYLMRRAAKIYMDLGLSAKAAQCTARALFYEKKYEAQTKGFEIEGWPAAIEIDNIEVGIATDGKPLN